MTPFRHEVRGLLIATWGAYLRGSDITIPMRDVIKRNGHWRGLLIFWLAWLRLLFGMPSYLR